MDPTGRDRPDGGRAIGVDDPTPRHEYRDEPPRHPPEYVEYVTDCANCGDGDAPRGRRICPKCEDEQHREAMMDARMETGL